MSPELLDPVRPDDPFLDPDGETGRRVLAAARHAPRRGRSRRPRALAAAGLVAAAALAAIVALPRGESAQAAIVHAAERTAAHDSGRIVWRLEAPDGEVTTVFRFQGADSAVTTDRRVGGRRGYLESREVGGRLYLLREGHWRDEGRARGRGAMAWLEALARDAGLIERLTDVTRAGDTFQATLPAGALTRHMPIVTLDVLHAAPETPVAVRVTVDGGLIRTLELRAKGTTITIDYRELGRPQEIAAP